MDKLRIGHALEVAPRGDVPRAAGGLITTSEMFKATERHGAQQISKDRAAGVRGVDLILISVQVETNYPRPSSETTQAYRVGGEPG